MIPCTNKIIKISQSEITAELSDPELLGAFFNSVSSSFNSKKEGRITVAQARYQKATNNQAKQRFKHSARSHPSNAVIKV
jgi:hypothetical protein